MIYLVCGQAGTCRWWVMATTQLAEAERRALEATRAAALYYETCQARGAEHTREGFEAAMGDLDPGGLPCDDAGAMATYLVQEMLEPRCGRTADEQIRYEAARQLFDEWWSEPLVEVPDAARMNQLIIGVLGVETAACFTVRRKGL